MTHATYVAYAAAYENVDDAVADFTTLKEAGLRHMSAAVVAKDADGRIHVHEKTHDGKVGAGVGAGVGAVTGIALGAIFLPAGAAVLADVVLSGVLGGAIGHFAGGLSRHKLKELGNVLDEGQAAVIAVGEESVATDVNKALSRAAKKAEATLDRGDVDAAITELQKGIDQATDQAASDLA